MIFLWGDFELFSDAILVLFYYWYSTASGHVCVKPSCVVLGEEWAKIPVDVDVLITHTPPANILDISPYNGKSIGALPMIRFSGCQLKPPESWFVVGFARHWTSILMSDKDIYSILFICTPDVEHATWRLVPGKVGISWILSFTLSFTCSMLFFGSVVLQMTLFLDPTHLVQAAWPEQWTRMNACNWVGVWR